VGIPFSTGAKFGLKIHLVVDSKQEIRNFVLALESMHDVSCAEEVLKNFQGTVIGDKFRMLKPGRKFCDSRLMIPFGA
jgi:hypothetical protein